MKARGKVGREGRGVCRGMDSPDQLTEVKVCPQYNFLIFAPPPPPRISDFGGAFCVAGGAFGCPCIDPTTTTATTSLLLRIHFSSIPSTLSYRTYITYKWLTYSM